MSRKPPHKSNGDTQEATPRPLLPGNWRWVQLGDLNAEEANSITDGPFGSKLKTEHYTSAGPRVIRLQNIGDCIFRNAEAHISDEHFQSLQKHRVFPNDLVIAALGETLPRACIVPETLGPAIVKADCIRFKANERLALPSYVCYALNSEPVRRRTAAIIHGVGRPRLNLKEIKSIWVPIAPWGEQHRIVEKIEELISELDAGVAALERARANLKRYRASVLKAAVEGALTADWRAKHSDVEPASKLLERILTERRNKWETVQLAKFQATGKQPPKNWRDKYKEPAPADKSNLPELPIEWCWATIEQLLAEPTCNGTSPKGRDTPPGVPALRLSAMTDRGFNFAERRYIDVSSSVAEELAIRENDFFVSRGNGSLHLVGRGTQSQAPQEQIVFPDTMIRVRLIDALTIGRWVNLIWPSRFIRSQIEKRARTTAGIYKISQGDVEGFIVPLPPPIERDLVIDEVAATLSQIETAESSIDHGLLRATRLRQSILKQAFEGKLVPQNRTDESVNTLWGRNTPPHNKFAIAARPAGPKN